MKYYKFLTAKNKGKYSNFDFTEYLPKGNKPGKWMPKVENIELCKSGYHCFKATDILEWLEAQLFEVEIRGEQIEGGEKTVAQQMRFVRKIENWNDKTERLFACWCARDVLPLFEREYPSDDRPRKAIETAERYANGAATKEELDEAWAAALAAAWAAAKAAASAAARDAAWAAAWAVAWAGARDAAWYAAWAAAWDKYTNCLIETIGINNR